MTKSIGLVSVKEQMCARVISEDKDKNSVISYYPLGLTEFQFGRQFGNFPELWDVIIQDNMFGIISNDKGHDAYGNKPPKKFIPLISATIQPIKTEIVSKGEKIIRKEKLGKVWGDGSNYYKVDPDTGKETHLRTYVKWKSGKSKRCIGNRRVWEDNHSVKSKLTVPDGKDERGTKLYKTVFLKQRYVGRKNMRRK
jgi:hypothetical protein